MDCVERKEIGRKEKENVSIKRIWILFSCSTPPNSGNDEIILIHKETYDVT